MTPTQPEKYIPINNPHVFLRFLHARRFSDREIAEYLNDPPLYLLHEHPAEESPVLYEPPPYRVWTARMVRRRREKWGLKKNEKVRREFRYYGELVTSQRQYYGKHWNALGLDLCRSQVDLLDALHAHGPATMLQLMARCGWSRPPRLHGNRTAIGPLVSEGLVEVSHTAEGGEVVRLYRLADGLAPVHNFRTDPRRPTGVEQKLRALGLE